MTQNAELTKFPAILNKELPTWTRPFADVAGLCLIALFLWSFVERNFRGQPDLNAYRFAGRAALAGLDPYVQDNLTTVAGHWVHPFLYTPVTLLPCLAIAFVPWDALALSWMWSKIALLGLLVLVWAKWFNHHEMVLPTAVLAVFGWRSSALADLWGGNVAIAEAALIWAGLAAFVANRRRLFACLIIATASFKIAPAAFLLLLLVPTKDQRPQWRTFFISLVALAAIVGGPLLAGPAAHYQRFWEAVPNWTLTGLDNPTVMGFLLDLARTAGWRGHVPWHMTFVIWGVYAAIILIVSGSFLRNCYRKRDARLWVMTVAFIYVLLMPRPLAYGFFMLTPAVLYFSPAFFAGSVGRWILTLTVSAHGFFKLTSIAPASPFSLYSPVLLNVCIWLLILSDDAKSAMVSVTPAPLRQERPLATAA